MQPRVNRFRIQPLLAGSILLLTLVIPILANASLPARIQIGLNLFPAVIAANKQLNQYPQTSAVTLYLLYHKNNQTALKASITLQEQDAIRGHPLNIRPISIEQLLKSEISQPAAIFITEPMDSELTEVMDFSKDQNVILFSPFSGDVEKGVMSGFKLTNKVLPAVNMRTLKQARIGLKAFFLRIAVKHDQ